MLGFEHDAVHRLMAEVFQSRDSELIGFATLVSDGAGAPEAITGDTSPHAGLAFARDGARVVNSVRKREHLI